MTDAIGLEALPPEIQLMVFEYVFSGRTINVNEAGKSSDAVFQDLIISKALHQAIKQAYFNTSSWNFPSSQACDQFLGRSSSVARSLRNIKFDVSRSYDNLAIIPRLTLAGSVLRSVTITGCTLSEFRLRASAPDVPTMATFIQSLCSVAGTLDRLSDRACQTTSILDFAELDAHPVVRAAGAINTLREVRVLIDECEPCELLGLECGHAAFESQIEAAVMARVGERRH